ncbi:MAG TPA: TetR/AcrR family transcriptional regulator [Nocardia sp.]|uniref:TetR/AcrR family transcriptional regulator n=1 Tax=Nocardia TaxID=1817 RepID=UPI0024542016|nr:MULTISPECIES: TetR/AcrR family transcriptional regulator [Nocardia]HLS78568.1 TetR/AcrR family transcriptional regulator [Nocardia sp.]
MTTTAKTRRYHHGDLRNALVRAAAELAETGGPEAVTVRAAARRVGVTPTAAYRHFTNHDELLDAAQEQAQQTLFAAMGETLAGLPPDADAVARLSAIGRGYITFARREPGLFRTAFCNREPSGPEEWNAPSFVLLSSLLDEMVEAGFTDPARRADAEYAAWAAVHGMALLIVDGALRHLTPQQHEAAIDRTLEMVRHGLGTGPRAAALLAAREH